MGASDPGRFERFVLRRQASVFHLALRMLRDPAEAEDATQETFLRAFQRFDRFDEARDEAAWIHVVATRVVLNRLRREKPRRRALAARAAAGTAVPAGEESFVERRESEEIVAEHVGRLPPEERAVVVLTYYTGLPQTDVATALSEPRSTVQSRLARALASLRASLTSTGSFAVVPALEDVMRGTAAPPVPEALARSLAHAAARAAAGSPLAVPLFTLGGIAVTKILALAAAALAVACLGSGYAVGRAFAGRGDDVPAERGVPAAEHARVVEENARLKQDLAGRLAVAPAGAPSRRGEGEAAGESPAAAGGGMETAGGSAAPAADGTAPLDWNRFAKVWADAQDLLDLKEGGDTDERMTPEQQQKAIKVWMTYLEVATKARELSPTPFFDARVLPGLVGAVLTPLDLPADARSAIDGKVRAALEQAAPEVAVADGRSLEVFAVRERVVDQVMEAVRASTPSPAREKLAKMEETASALLGGVRQLSEFGVEPGKPQAFTDRVLEVWREAGLDEGQVNALRPAAESFARDALDAWRGRGLDREGTAPTPEERRAFEREVLRAQIAAERTLDGALTPAQREKYRRMPKLIRPKLGGDHLSITNGGGI